MTLAESEAARQRLQALKAADRTESRLFENLSDIRAIEATTQIGNHPTQSGAHQAGNAECSRRRHAGADGRCRQACAGGGSTVAARLGRNSYRAVR